MILLHYSLNIYKKTAWIIACKTTWKISKLLYFHTEKLAELVGFADGLTSTTANPLGVTGMKKFFSKNILGFYICAKHAAESWGISRRSVDNMLRSDTKPNRKYEECILKAADAVHFPLDEPPLPSIIGVTAHRASIALRQGNHEYAYLLTKNGLDGGTDWFTGTNDQFAGLEAAWLEYINALVWIRHHSPDQRYRGYCGMKRVNRLAKLKLAESGSSFYSPYWVHLFSVSKQFRAVYVAITTKDHINNSKRLQHTLNAVCKELLTNAEPLQTYAKALTAWNIAQIATLTNNTNIFIGAYGVLCEIYGIERVNALLNNDDDTAMMLKKNQRYLKQGD